MSAPVCIIVVHPPASAAPAPAVATNLGSLSALRRSPGFQPCSPASSLPAVSIPADQYLLPPGITMRRRKTRSGKNPKIPPASRGRRMPDPWKVIPGTQAGQFVLVPVRQPEEISSISAVLSSVPSSTPCQPTATLVPVTPASAKPTTPATSAPALPAESSSSTLVGYKDPRLVPYLESAFYIAMFLAYMQYTFIPLLL